jgi:NTE family protein
MRIGLVLGAGGAVGVAYHGAVLATLAEVTGWDPRSAEVIVGTSAGAVSAAMLRAGVPAVDLARISEGLPLSKEGEELASVGRPHRPRPKPADLLRFRPFADLGAVLHAATHPLGHPWGALVAAVLPAGGVPTEALSSGIDHLYRDSWPTKALWLCSVRLSDGERVVFGHDDGGDATATVGQAVAASCAIPSYFQPVVIKGQRYVDGGVHSVTNVDLVRGIGLDVVVVSAPMSLAQVWPPVAPPTWLRHPVHARLQAELADLRRGGTATVALEPNREVVAAMGLNPMDASHRGPVSRVTRREVGRWLATSAEGRWLVAMLSGAGLSDAEQAVTA